MKVLWLVSWYPNKYDLFDGDFVQRHARAAALYDDITVLFIKQAAEQTALQKVEQRQHGLTERLIYLPKKNGWMGKLSNFYNWQKVYKKEAAALIKEKQPQVVHVHVPWKAGLLALWIRKKYSIPYVVTEHWDIYNRVVTDNIHNRSWLFRFLLKQIYKHTEKLISVSKFIAVEIDRMFGKQRAVVVLNVVDTDLFHRNKEKHDRFTFLHVSNLAAKKNAEGLLSAFRSFLEKTASGAQLIIAGNKDEHYVQIAEEMGLLNSSVYFKGEIPNDEVAREMQQAHVFVLNSDMENSPCVIGEALCCGLPVIATNVGGVPELVTEENSILIPPRDTAALAAAFQQMEKNYTRFRPEEIADRAHDTFSMQAVGLKLHHLYNT